MRHPPSYYAERHERERREIEAIKDELSRKHGIPRDKKFDIAWQIAWINGHSGGYGDVESCFDELVELLKP